MWDVRGGEDGTVEGGEENSSRKGKIKRFPHDPRKEREELRYIGEGY